MNSVFRPAALLLAGRSFGLLAAFGIPIFLARIFSVSEFGTYKQVFLIYGTLLAIAQIGMAESLYYFLPVSHDKGGRHAANTFAVLGLAGLVCLVLVWLGQKDIGSLFNNPALPRYLPMLGAFLAFSLAAILLEITMTSRKRFRAAAGTYAISEILRAGFFLVPVAIFGGIEALLWGAVVFGALRFMVTFVYLRRHFGPGLRPDWHVLREQFAYALPFAAAVTIEVTQGTLHFYAVGHYFDPTRFAIYAVGCLQIPIVNLVITSTSNVMMVRMQELRSEGLHDQVAMVWRDTTIKLSLLFMPMVAALLILANPLITLLYTAKYAASIPVFMVSIGMIVLTSIMTDSVLRVYAQTRLLVALNLVRLGVVASTILALISLFGITGAVASTVLAALVFKVLGLIRIKRLLKCSLSQVLPWGGLARAALVSTGAALPALVAKLLTVRAGLAPIVVLLVASVVYAVAYLILFRFFAPLSGTEKAALFLWLRKPLSRLLRASGPAERRLHRRGVRQ